MLSLDALLESNVLPDTLIRAGIRHLLAGKLREEDRGDVTAQKQALLAHIAELKVSPIAVQTRAANKQHYEVPTRFFQLALGKRLKYSSGWWPESITTLDEAEETMLALTCERAQLVDGQSILELGLRLGFALALDGRALSHGPHHWRFQFRHAKEYVDGEAAKRGLENLTIITDDINIFEAPGLYDRVVSVEMFEHMKNYEALLGKVASWLEPAARFSSTSSPIAVSPIISRTKARATGWRVTFLRRSDAIG